jgi:kinesin family protein 18/19
VFDKTTKFLCDGLLDGFNSTVFSYGSTGAGKTHTMIGTQVQPGIMYNTMNHIFKLIGNDENVIVKVSFLEIYNEMIRDLIMPSNDILDVREDPIRGIQIVGLTNIAVKTAQEILELLTLGNKNRICEATGAN